MSVTVHATNLKCFQLSIGGINVICAYVQLFCVCTTRMRANRLRTIATMRIAIYRIKSADEDFAADTNHEISYAHALAALKRIRVCCEVAAVANSSSTHDDAVALC